MASSPVTINSIDPLIATTMRVLRKVSTAEDLITAWPLLKEKSLSSPPTLTDHERRLYFDLPDKNMEDLNISEATSLSRSQLIEKALSHQDQLTTKEAVLLLSRFWTPITYEENTPVFNALLTTSEEAQIEFYEGRNIPLASDENKAFSIGSYEFHRREKHAADEKVQDAADIAFPNALEWIQQLYREGKGRWGFVCLWDAAWKDSDPEWLEDAMETLGAVLEDACRYNGTQDLIARRWDLLHFYAPDTSASTGGAAPRHYPARRFSRSLTRPSRIPERSRPSTLGLVTIHRSDS
ncbi:hypothetical protein ONS96_009632 [Cadophora gregata f. sp. sojae]|nr:hypothetical protein ONS96_009632 [Cadophora gregata f. sp. sojae]